MTFIWHLHSVNTHCVLLCGRQSFSYADRKMKIPTPVHSSQANPGVGHQSSSENKLTILSASPLALPNRAPQESNLPWTRCLLSHSCKFSGFPLLEDKSSQSGRNIVSQSIPCVPFHPHFLAHSCLLLMVPPEWASLCLLKVVDSFLHRVFARAVILDWNGV